LGSIAFCIVQEKAIQQSLKRPQYKTPKAKGKTPTPESLKPITQLLHTTKKIKFSYFTTYIYKNPEKKNVTY
jgi:hypothetical protein